MKRAADAEPYDNAPLPRVLAGRAAFSPNGREFALPAGDALSYLQWCTEQGLQVLGYDVWAMTVPLPTVVLELIDEGDAAYCIEQIRSLDLTAIEREYGVPPVFNIWTADEDAE